MIVLMVSASAVAVWHALDCLMALADLDEARDWFPDLAAEYGPEFHGYLRRAVWFAFFGWGYTLALILIGGGR